MGGGMHAHMGNSFPRRPEMWGFWVFVDNGGETGGKERWVGGTYRAQGQARSHLICDKGGGGGIKGGVGWGEFLRQARQSVYDATGTHGGERPE